MSQKGFSKKGSPVAGACVAFGLAVLIATGCTEDPTAESLLGSQLITTRVALAETTITAAGTSTKKRPIPMNSATNLVGKSGGYLAYAPLRFAPLLNDTVDVIGASIRLKLTSRFGNLTGSLNLNVYKILKDWREDTLTWRGVTTDFYDPASLGSLTEVATADTQEVFVTITDTTLIRNWLQGTGDPNYGLLLFPDPSCDLVRGFEALNFFPDSASIPPTLQIETRGPTGTIDTLKYAPIWDTFVGNIDGFDSDSTRVTVQAGVVYTGIFKFDVSFLPQGSIIASANMVLHLDDAATLLTRPLTEKVVASRVVLSPSDTLLLESTFTRGEVRGSDPNEFSFDARHATQFWATGTNYGVGVTALVTKEFSSFDRFVFFNNTAPDAMKPKLKIVYGVVQN